MATKIQLRRDTAANWTTANTVLAAGEMGIEVDGSGNVTGAKTGNGTVAWASLPYSLGVLDGTGKVPAGQLPAATADAPGAMTAAQNNSLNGLSANVVNAMMAPYYASGDGVSSDITGTATYYGGGGGGGFTLGGAGDNGGGGRGDNYNAANGAAGTPLTGGGGGGVAGNAGSQKGYNGGSGVVYVRYSPQ
jgi:hypothetical protein